MLLTRVHAGQPPWVLIQAPRLTCWDNLGNILEFSVLQGSDLKAKVARIASHLGMRIEFINFEFIKLSCENRKASEREEVDKGESERAADVIRFVTGQYLNPRPFDHSHMNPCCPHLASD